MEKNIVNVLFPLLDSTRFYYSLKALINIIFIWPDFSLENSSNILITIHTRFRVPNSVKNFVFHILDGISKIKRNEVQRIELKRDHNSAQKTTPLQDRPVACVAVVVTFIVKNFFVSSLSFCFISKCVLWIGAVKTVLKEENSTNHAGRSVSWAFAFEILFLYR